MRLPFISLYIALQIYSLQLDACSAALVRGSSMHTNVNVIDDPVVEILLTPIGGGALFAAEARVDLEFASGTVSHAGKMVFDTGSSDTWVYAGSYDDECHQAFAVEYGTGSIEGCAVAGKIAGNRFACSITWI
jgi:hypothetical protein